MDDVRALVAVIVQTDRYGTNVASALRIHADQFRTRRRQRAEAQGERASVKLVFPLVLCFFPALYVAGRDLGPDHVQNSMNLDGLSTLNLAALTATSCK